MCSTRTLYKSQGGLCFYCKEPMLDFITKTNGMSNFQFTQLQQQPLYPTFEHAITLKRDGGTKSIENGVCACYLCNQLKGIISHNAFRMLVTSKESQQLLMECPPPSIVTISPVNVIKDTANVVVDVIRSTIKRLNDRQKRIATEKGQPPTLPIIHEPYTIANHYHIKKALIQQDHKCYCCGGEIIPMYSLPRDEFVRHGHRPVYKKHNKTVVRMKCSGKAKNNKK